jgi:lipopolysaccharide/colanic/teichoic acid biosynthesis glycosyltransferase
MSYAVEKRVFDIVFAGFGLLVVLPAGLIIGLLVKLCDGGPVFYGQTRIGQFGKPFRIWKFRSMVANADKIGVLLTSGKDPRITPVGRILRKTKLDELPQLWNVLRGDMTFVGPRPEVPCYVQRYTPDQARILKQKPGITDLATLLFRNEEALLNGAGDVEDFYLRYCLPRKIELNQQYAERATLLQDIWIIVQTLCPYWAGVLAVYSVSLTASFWVAYELRTDFRPTRQDYAEFLRCVPLIVIPQLGFLVWRGQVRGLLSYFSIPEMRKIVTALAAAFVVQLAFGYAIYGHSAPSRSILLMDFILSFFMLCGVRMLARLFRERFSRPRLHRESPPRRVAIIGTGELATSLVLDFARSEKSHRRVVAFFDDDPRTWHKRPYDIPVVGMPECLLTREWRQQVEEVIVTLPPDKAARIQEISEMLQALPYEVTIASGWPVLRTTSGGAVGAAFST